MHFDFRELPAQQRYKLLTATIVPRPIALVTSLNTDGQINAAPFSFFNCMGSDPPIIALAPGDRSDGTPKDTALNIRKNGEFVVNLVSEAIAQAMNICAVDFPHGHNELAAAGLSSVPSQHIKAPRIAESPVNLECREYTTLQIGRNRIVIGEVLCMHIEDEFIDTQKLYVDTENLHLVGRMHGGGGYTRTRDIFHIERLTFEEWQNHE